MKKIFLAFTATSALLLAAFTTAHTQERDAVASAKTGKSSAELLAFKSSSASDATASAKASKMAARAVKNFQKSFKNVENADWLVAEDGGFIASFNEEGIKNTVVYDDHGHWMHSIKRYSEKQLPKSIVQAVKSNYYEYDIICGEEIDVNSHVVFLVHIKTEHNAKTIRIADDDMEVIEDLTN